MRTLSSGAAAGSARAGLSARLQARWLRLPEAERRRVPLVLGILALASALALHAMLTMPARLKAEQDHARQSQRAAAVKKAPKQAAPRWVGKSAGTLRREVQGLQDELATQRARLADLEPRFASLAQVGPSRDLFEALTGLAASADMELETLEQQGLKREERDLPPSVGRLAGLAAASPYQRPLVRLKARASYRGLMQFLDGLSSLPHTVAPVWISIEVATDARNGGRPRLQWLNVEMDLNL
jgi:hypothetical protein